MATKNGYITSPVDWRDIARTIGATTGHLTNQGLHPNVSKWSSRKPTDRDSMRSLTGLQAKQDIHNNPYGLELPFIGSATASDGAPLYHPDGYINEEGQWAQWVYRRPTRVRQADFHGYEHYIADLFTVVSIRHDSTAHELTVRVSINQESCRHDATLHAAGGNAGDGISWGHLTPRNFYLPGSTTLRLADYFAGVAMWDTAGECWAFIKTAAQPIGASTEATLTLPTTLFDEQYLIAPCLCRNDFPDGVLSSELELTDCIAMEMARPLVIYLSNYAVGTMLLDTRTGRATTNYYTYSRGSVTRETAVVYAPNDKATQWLFDDMPLRTLVLSGGLVSYKPASPTEGSVCRLPLTTLNLRDVAGSMYLYLTVTYSGGGWTFGLHTYEESAEGTWEQAYNGPLHTHKAVSRVVVSNNVSGTRAQSCNVTVWYTDGEGAEQTFTFPTPLRAFISYEREGAENLIYVGTPTTDIATNLPDSYTPDYELMLTASLDENLY